jgi:hypothetical protein
MDDTCLPKMAFNAKTEGRRGIGRPRLRWLDDVEADIKALGMKRWRIKAQDRKEWSEILREAKTKLKGREIREEEKEQKKMDLHTTTATFNEFFVKGKNTNADGG